MSKYFSYLPKKTLIVIFGVIMALSMVAVAVASADWGPDRPTKPWLGDGTAGFDHVTFNSFTGVPSGIGDERDFTRGMVIGRDSATTDPVDGAKANDILYVTMWVHNGADPSLNASGDGVAINTSTRVSIPTTAGTTHNIKGYVNADNIAPAGPYWDTVTINTTAETTLEFVPGSATIKTNALDYVSLSDNVFTSGVLIGDDGLDGNMPGCFDYGAWVNFKVKVVEVKKPVEPVYACKALTVAKLGGRTIKATVDASGTPADRVHITGYSFNFGDNSSVNSTTNVKEHTYASDGTYAVVATVSFDVDGQTKTATCSGNVTFSPIVTPPELPNTGPASTFGVIFGTSALGLAIRGFLRSRRDLNSTLVG